MRAQGLPINTIIVVIVIVLVAVVVIVMWVFGGGRPLSSIAMIVGGGTPTDKSAAVMICEQLCDKIKTTLDKIEDLRFADFCLKVFDLSKENSNYPVNDHCYSGETAWPGGTLKKADGNGANEVLAVRCSLRLADGKVCTSINVTCCNNPTSANCGCI
ncbi:MAG: hypothetical protein OH335_00845 [Candidatus Parvarchaeota archaeon]|nr:hypothetical protein [Candidatus Jingweiarchaeum tengchongense]